MIKTVIFDLGKVIIPFDFKRGYQALEQVCGYPAAEIPRRIGTTDLVQRLQTARQALSLESAIDKLDKYHLIILDDLCYVNRDQAETSALFELIAARYERRSLLVTANRPFGEWTTVFPDAAMTLAAVDRLVHHAVILEMNVESYRQRSAAARQNRRAPSDSKHDIKHKEVITASST